MRFRTLHHPFLYAFAALMILSGQAGNVSAEQPATAGNHDTPYRNITGTSLPGPIRTPPILHTAQWLIINHATLEPDNSWHAPALTPALADAAKLEREARHAQRMADRAFYFGVDADNNALE